MSNSLYYSVKSSQELKESEARQLSVYLTAYDQVEGKHATETFCFDTDPLELIGSKDWELKGSIKLTKNQREAWEDIQIFGSALATMRYKILPGAAWHFFFDDKEFSWLEDKHQYDYS